MKKNKLKLLVMSAVVSTSLIFGSVSAFASEQSDNAKVKVEQAVNNKTFYNYMMAYIDILNLPQDQQGELLNQLAPLWNDVNTAKVQKARTMLENVAKNKDGKTYAETEAYLSGLSDSDMDAWTKGYLLGELTSWGRQFVFTDDYKQGVDSLSVAWSKKDNDSIKNLENMIAKVKNENSKKYLTEELDKLKAKISEENKDIPLIFKDANLEKAIRYVLKKPTGDITYKDAESVTELIIYEWDIKNLDGIEAFKNLTKLSLYGNKIQDISLLSNLTKLDFLSIRNNQIYDVSSLKNLKNLKLLMLRDNNITDFTPLKDLYDNLANYDFDLKGNTVAISDKGTYVGQWKNNAINGIGTFTLSNGDYYTGEWKNNIMEGKGVFVSKSTGEKYEGEFQNNNMNGYGVLTKADGTVYSGQWKDGQLVTSSQSNTSSNSNTSTTNNSSNSELTQSIRNQYLTKLAELKQTIENVKNNKNVKVLKKQTDGTYQWEYTYNETNLNIAKDAYDTYNMSYLKWEASLSK
jgi:hypothetical protein